MLDKKTLVNQWGPQLRQTLPTHHPDFVAQVA
jgi:hypothetical protein